MFKRIKKKIRKLSAIRYQLSNLKAGSRKLKPSKSRQAFTLMELLVAIGIFSIFLGAVTTSYVSIVRGHGETNDRRKMLGDVRYLVDFISDELRQGTVDYWHTYCLKTDFEQSQKQIDTNPFAKNNDGITNEFRLSQKKCSGSKLVRNGLTDTLTIVSKDGSTKTTIRLKNGKVEVNKEAQAFQDLNKIKSDSSFREALNVYKPQNELFQNFQELDLDSTQIDTLQFLVTPLDDPYASRNYEYSTLQFQPQVTLFLTAGVPNEDPTQPAKAPVNIQTTISSRLYSPRE